MTAQDVLSIIMGAGVGIGIAFWIAASILEKRNNVGDSHGETYLYSNDVMVTDKEKLQDVFHPKLKEYIQRVEPEAPKYPTAPNSKEQVKRTGQIK